MLPAGNDVARLAPLRAKRAVSSAMGSGTYFAQEGVFEFGAKEWGPQPLQLLLSSVDCNCGALGVAADAGVKEMKDLRGQARRLRGRLAGAEPELAGDAWPSAASPRSDVKVVEFASYGAMWKGLINNDADAAFGTTITGPAKEAETSPRGLMWPPLPASDKEGWARVKKVGSFFFPQTRDLRRRHLAGQAGRARQLPLPDLRRLRLAAGRPDLRDHQGDDRRITTPTRTRRPAPAASPPTARPRTGSFRCIPAR